MKRPEGLPDELIPLYNDFVNVCNENKILFSKFALYIGIFEGNVQGLSFDFETELGLTNDYAIRVFDDFIKRNKNTHISYNIRTVSKLEEVLSEMSDSVIELREGFELKLIETTA